MRLLELFDSTSNSFRELDTDEWGRYGLPADITLAYEFHAPTGTYVFFFEPSHGGAGMYSFSFGKATEHAAGQRRLEYNPTGEGGEFRVYAAVVSMLKEFFIAYNPQSLVLEPYTTRQRYLYANMLKRFTKMNPQYDFIEEEDAEFLLFRKP